MAVSAVITYSKLDSIIRNSLMNTTEYAADGRVKVRWVSYPATTINMSSRFQVSAKNVP